MIDPGTALRILDGGAIRPQLPDGATNDEWDAAQAHLACSIIAKGRIASRHTDGTRNAYTVNLAIVVDHPDLIEGGCFALLWTTSGAPSPAVYTTTPEVALAALRHPSVFNFT